MKIINVNLSNYIINKNRFYLKVNLATMIRNYGNVKIVIILANNVNKQIHINGAIHVNSQSVN